MTRQQVTAIEVRRVGPGESFGGCALKVDGAGARFDAIVHYGPNNASSVWVDKFDPTGQLVGSWEVFAPSAGGQDVNKLDSVCMAATGADLLVGVVSHYTVSRPYPYQIARIPGVYSPYPGGLVGEDAAGAFVPTEEGETVSIDYDLIALKVWERGAGKPYEAARMDLLGNMKAKSIAAIVEQDVLREATVHSSDGLYSRIKETVYQQLEKFLDPK